MKLTVLIDNNTLIDRYFLAEPGLSFLIQTEDMNIVFDVGYSGAFLINAANMNIDINILDAVVISHGHMDHTWGLFYLIKHYVETNLEGISITKPDLIAHPWAFNPKTEEVEIGSLINESTLSRHFDLKLSIDPFWLTEKLVFLGEIERSNDFENNKPIGKVLNKEVMLDDYLKDDSAMVYKSKEGLIIVTGCSHAGICNIIEYAKKICNDDRIIDVIGGFHLLEPEKEILNKTCNYIKVNNVKMLHPCHCTDLGSKIALSKHCIVEEVGVGTVLEYD